MDIKLIPIGDTAVTLHFGSKINEKTGNRIQSFTSLLIQQSYSWLIEFVPAYTTVTIYYDPINLMEKGKSPFSYIKQTLQDLADKIKDESNTNARTIEIPVCYGEDYGPDLEHVATSNKLSKEQVIDLHSNSNYRVYMLGFTPGFPYIGGLDEALATPRKQTPASRIPEGSVGIAGHQTGIYPNESPGGWQIIGRTPLKLFKAVHKPPTLLQAGDRVRFRSITEQEFLALKEDER
ncbi:5-oxoprolinase subunit PxpB [Alkalihalobacillus sp. AL-G]|uniref:5-oxoprolinase subunit PxpB n=1 Tax=Alkalihalobacillus sp. AL-G TaxID=2926399 RepID=UPI00272DA017|nr:5-oxoprolinase subunit PxpB [Alkalihalobacillus sp. AL-G]WLD94209.1 5-oxoprolinase subunit PxpB [Alkalihalobacillus sp. AL-G]